MDEIAIPGAPDEFVHVFVSYAREDKRWLDPDYRFSLIPFLMESLRRYKVAIWFDKELKPGDEFKRHIETQIDQSQIALLIVSQNFLNSEFIENREMPRVAERARLGQMVVVPVLVEPCDWSEYPFLADRQMVPSSPLIEYTESEPQWAKVRFQILDGLKAQVKRIRQIPQSESVNSLTQPAEPGETIAAAAEKEREQLREAETLRRSAAERQERETEVLRIEAEQREKEIETLRLKEAADKQALEAEQRKTRAEEAEPPWPRAEASVTEARTSRISFGWKVAILGAGAVLLVSVWLAISHQSSPPPQQETTPAAQQAPVVPNATVAPKPAPLAPGTLSGVVVDRTGDAIPGATIEIRRPDKDFARDATTDANGKFTFAGVPAFVSLSATAQGSGEFDIDEVLVPAGKTKVIRLQLPIIASMKVVVAKE